MSAPAYEPSDIPPKGAALAIAGILAGLLIAGALVAAVLSWVGSITPAGPATIPDPPPPPRLEVDALADRARIEDAAKARLRGDAHHPSIEQAMAIVAREGWRDRQQQPPTVIEAARAHTEAER